MSTTWISAGNNNETDDIVESSIHGFGYTIVLWILLALALSINGVFMYVVVKVRSSKCRSHINFFLFNLAIADTLFVLIIVPLEAASVYAPDDVIEVNCIGSFMISVFQYTGMFTITAISIERYIAICLSLKVQRVGPMTRAKIFITAAWVCGIVFAVLIILAACVFTTGKVHYLMMMLFQTMPFLITLCTVSVLYFLIVRFLKKKQAEAFKIGGELRQFSRTKETQHVIRVLGVTTFLFFFCVFPDQVLYFLILLDGLGVVSLKYEDSFTITYYICRILLVLNSVINPIIYTSMSSKYRMAYKQAFAPCCRCKANSVCPESDGNNVSFTMTDFHSRSENSALRKDESSLVTINPELSNTSVKH
ncbi:thyrotropin-releasing hormone receptor-like [Saccoglossus kowalevskii]